MTTAVIIHVSLCTALIAALLVKFASSFELVAATRAIFHPALFRPRPTLLILTNPTRPHSPSTPPQPFSPHALYCPHLHAQQRPLPARLSRC